MNAINNELIKKVFDKPYLGSHTFIHADQPDLFFSDRITLADMEDQIWLVPYGIFSEFKSLVNNCFSDAIFGCLAVNEGFLPGDDLPLYTNNFDRLRWFRSFDDAEFNTDIEVYPDDRDEIYCELIIDESDIDEDEMRKSLPTFDNPDLDIEYPFVDQENKKHPGFAKIFAKNGATLVLVNPIGSNTALKEGIVRLPTKDQFTTRYAPGKLADSDYEDTPLVKPKNEKIPKAFVPSRAVNAYIASNLSAFNSEIDLLIWSLSLIKNKKLGFKTVLYIDTKGKELLEEKEIILPLYDEVHTIDIEEYNNINLKDFWAVAKFHAMKEELKNHGTDFFIMDIDFSFMNDDIVSVFKKEPVVFWDNREEFYWVYPELNFMSVPDGFKYPKYIDPNIRPINSAIIRCTSEDILNEWISLFFKFITGNPVTFKEGYEDEEKRFKGLASWICTAEQRFLGCILNWYGVKPYFFRTEEKSFLKSHFHTWIFKNAYNNRPRLLQTWLAAFIALIYREGEEYYNHIVKSISKFPTLSLVINHFEMTHFPPPLKIYLN